uniref:RNA-directed DNA polymerase n=1 Tax=Strongyloides papillosus TaxID=174720 RepID=A0A0N5B6S6_STREA
MRRRTRSTNPITTTEENLTVSQIFENIQQSANSEVLLNMSNTTDPPILNGGQINPETPTNGNLTTQNHPPTQPNGIDMGQLQNVINEMIRNAINNYLPAVLPQVNQPTCVTQPPPQVIQPPCVTNVIPTNQIENTVTENVNDEMPIVNNREDLDMLNVHRNRMIYSNDRHSSVMPEKFNVKDNFAKWEIKFNSYCRMNRISEIDKLDTLILLLDNKVLQEVYDDPSISSSYLRLAQYLRRNFNGGLTIQAASDELDLLIARRVTRADDLDNVARKIDNYIDIMFPSDNRERKNEVKIKYLSKVLPSAIQGNYFCKPMNTLDEGLAAAKTLWFQELRAEKDKARGHSILKSYNHRSDNRNVKPYQHQKSHQNNLYCSYCKMNNHSTATCRNSKNKLKAQSNNIEVNDPQSNNIEIVPKDVKTDLINKDEMKNDVINNEVCDNYEVQKVETIDESPPLPQNHSFRAVVKLNGLNVIALIDTGSNCVIINNKLKDKLGLTTCEERNISTFQSDNTALKISTPITIQIQKEKFIINENVYAAKDDFKNNSYDAIIGTNVLKRMMAVIDLQTGKIIVNEKPKDLVKDDNNISNVILSDQDANINIDKFVTDLKLKYPLAYARHSFDIGPGRIMVNEIEVYNNKEMIKAPYYSVPIHEKESVSNLLQTWIDNGLLERSESNCLHPIMLLTKDGKRDDLESCRFIADLRQVNSITKSVNYNTPKIQELLQSLQSFSFITKIDLKSAFFQLSLPPKSRQLYGIRTPIGNLQFKRLPQGGKVSSAIFQRTMEETFYKLRKNCLIYCDDILLFSNGTIQDHEQLINQFMKIANEKELKVSLEKSVFFAREAKFLGYHITSSGTRPDSTNVDNILKRELPKRKKQLISFLQALNYFRHVIPNFSRTASCLYELSAGRDCAITMNEQQLECYHALRQQLMNAPLMYHPIHGIPFTLTTDASNHTIGAILSQTQNGIEVPLAFYSCRLTKTKRARSPTFLELYAIAKSLQHFKYLLSSAEIIIRSDHKPLLHLSTSNSDKKYMELLETINQFNVKWSYIPGKSNFVADWLSRLCNENSPSPSTNTVLDTSNVASSNEIVKRQRGRPRKCQRLNSSVENLKNVKGNTIQPVDIKRRRGRPVKNISKLSNSAITITRKRGRPRKCSHKSDNITDLTNNFDKNVDTDEKVLPLSSDVNSKPIDDTTIQSSDDDLTFVDAATEIMSMIDLTKLDLVKLQSEDVKCQNALSSGKLDNHVCYKDKNGLIKVKIGKEETTDLIVIPESAADTIFKLSHDFNGHFSFLKTKENINKSCYISGLAKKLENYLKNCHHCKIRNTVMSQQGPTKTILPANVMEELSMDFLGPLKVLGSKKQKFILNVIDTGSRFVFPIPTQTQQHEEIMYHLMNDIFLKFGFPRKIRCDNAQNFKANSLKELLGRLNIQLEYSTPQYSKSNSICERYLRTLQAGVNKLISMTGRDWDCYIPYLAYAYNTNIIRSFNMSPFQLMFARSPTTALDLFLRGFDITLHDRELDIYEMMERAQVTRDIANERHLQERLYVNNGNKNKEFKTYAKNDLIYVKNKMRKGKFDNVYDGPYPVVTDLGSKIKYKAASGRILTSSKTNLRS